MDSNREVIERLLAALGDRDEQAVAAELDPAIEAVGQRGPKHGIAEVVAWASPSDDGQLRSRVEVDELRDVGGDHVAVAARRQWRWAEGDELADEAPFGVLFELRDGKVYRWRQDFDSIVDAIESIPVERRRA